MIYSVLLLLSASHLASAQSLAVKMARSDFEVTQMRGAGRHALKGNEEGLVAYLPLDEGEGRRIVDAKSGVVGEWTANVQWNEQKQLVLTGGRLWGLATYNPPLDPAANDFSVVVAYKSSQPPDANHSQAATLLLSSPNLFAAGWSISLRRNAICVVAGPEPDPHQFTNQFEVNNLFDGEWHTIALVRKSGTVKCFFDGCEAGSFVSNAALAGHRGEISIGGVTNWSLGLNGSLRDCSIWNRALTPAEVAAMAMGSSELSAEIFAPKNSKQLSARVLDGKGGEIKGAAVIQKDTKKVALARLPVGSYTLEVKDDATGKTAKTTFRVWRYDLELSPTGVLQGRSIGARVSIDGPDKTIPRGLKVRVVGTKLSYDVKGAGEIDINTAPLDEGTYEVELVDETLGFTKREKFRVWK
jgi:hypothetical protein